MRAQQIDYSLSLKIYNSVLIGQKVASNKWLTIPFYIGKLIFLSLETKYRILTKSLSFLLKKWAQNSVPIYLCLNYQSNYITVIPLLRKMKCIEQHIAALVEENEPAHLQGCLRAAYQVTQRCILHLIEMPLSK